MPSAETKPPFLDSILLYSVTAISNIALSSYLTTKPDGILFVILLKCSSMTDFAISGSINLTKSPSANTGKQ